ncbi:MAG: molybdopterin-guanine dinucleotide biosynthesis protein B [Selenomonadaceae bacterium]|nr:molybdopterin-guanine dinucleotide biosynthesis protein B [Selenomonadaceae bacterium]
MKGVSLLIIAGGKSSRLGQDKRFVEIGGVGLLELMLRKACAAGFDEIFLCVEEDQPALRTLADRFGATLLVDDIRGAGPLSGLAKGLKHVSTDWALAVSTDMPFFEFEVVRPLMKHFSSTSAVVPKVGGKRQMLAAFYRRELTEIFSAALADGQRKIMTALEGVPHVVEEVPRGELFFNVNTPADLRLARGRAANLSRSTPIVSIVAPKSGTGKTTFIERLTKIFSDRGVTIGVVKSDAHGFNLDVEGKDSWRFQNAGAKSVAVVSPDSWFMIQKTDGREPFINIVEKMTGVDLILTESRTRKIFPTISLWRGLGEKIIDENICAVFTVEPQPSDEISEFDLNDADAAEQIVSFLAGMRCRST